MTLYVRPPQRPVLDFSFVAGATSEMYTADWFSTPAGVPTPAILRVGAYRIVYLGYTNPSFTVALMADPPAFLNPAGVEFNKLVLTGTFSGGAATLTLDRASASSVLFDNARQNGTAKKFAIPAASTFGLVNGNTYQGQIH